VNIDTDVVQQFYIMIAVFGIGWQIKHVPQKNIQIHKLTALQHHDKEQFDSHSTLVNRGFI
jgi:hypothetical protein